MESGDGVLHTDRDNRADAVDSVGEETEEMMKIVAELNRIAVVLSEGDRVNIANMKDGCTVYGIYNDEKYSPEEIEAWMQAIKALPSTPRRASVSVEEWKEICRDVLPDKSVEAPEMGTRTEEEDMPR